MSHLGSDQYFKVTSRKTKWPRPVFLRHRVNQQSSRGRRGALNFIMSEDFLVKFSFKNTTFGLENARILVESRGNMEIMSSHISCVGKLQLRSDPNFLNPGR